MGMISFDAGSHRFHLRAAAIVVRGDDVLLHRAEGDDFWALPGGRVESGEEAAIAVARELHEELGLVIEAGPLVLLVENFFVYGGERQHEVGLYFMAEPQAGSPVLAGPGPYRGVEGTRELVFAWFARSALGEVDLRPCFLVDALGAQELSFRHVVQRDQRAG
ncbi:NUDIX domain-containing protein [Rhizobacter sp. SG703]|uniref:NUDIX hydrolase n=1 Tax=Rhizobacter sp. SG703 TaxID=2587140 RepID=UPI0017F98B55|nr:NUDIX domain-containing protein [Rhizobacter sp. SG703]NKI97025.1 ADP-ribose pyrophosphatase YjhB (NUDIX family) [Rhizobacter sp. SG703]